MRFDFVLMFMILQYSSVISVELSFFFPLFVNFKLLFHLPICVCLLTLLENGPKPLFKKEKEKRILVSNGDGKQWNEIYFAQGNESEALEIPHIYCWKLCGELIYVIPAEDNILIDQGRQCILFCRTNQFLVDSEGNSDHAI